MLYQKNKSLVAPYTSRNKIYFLNFQGKGVLQTIFLWVGIDCIFKKKTYSENQTAQRNINWLQNRDGFKKISSTLYALGNKLISITRGSITTGMLVMCLLLYYTILHTYIHHITLLNFYLRHFKFYNITCIRQRHLF